MKRSFLPLACLVAACAAASVVGCAPASPTNPVLVEGELGNGGFLFLCDDSVQCDKTSTDVSRFPKAIAIGATFDVRYRLKTHPSLIKISLDSSAADQGITVQPATLASSSTSATKYEYISRGPSGFLGLQTGFATLVARDRKGAVVDYVTVKLQKPDAIAIYDAATKIDPPPRVGTVELVTGETASFRAVAQKASQDLGGALQVEWTADPPGILSVAGQRGVKATVTAKAPGTGTLTATAGGFTQKITVEVK
ncbi:MAG: hypothetical protein JST00_14120 [Deltaproteobacteria bacterium]|nr:hypothetical protein [Deltaproteobacteria bacterium]